MITRGDFSFILRDSERVMLEDAFQVISTTEGAWEYLARPDIPDPNCGFMFTRDPFLLKLGNQIDRDGKIGHSGSTYGCTMRQMEYIAKHGWDVFVEMKITQQNQSSLVFTSIPKLPKPISVEAQ